MKKLICLALAMLLAVCLIPALAEEAVEAEEYFEPSPLGDWYTDLAGITLQLTLNEDGSYFYTVLGEAGEPGQWTLEDGFVYLDGDEEAPFSFSEAALFSEKDELIYTREAPEPYYTPAEPWAEAPSYYYDGHWMCIYTEVNGFLAPADLLDADTEIWIETELGDAEVEDGVVLSMTYGDAMAALGGARFGDVIESFVYQDGAYIGKLTDSGADITLQLLTDDVLKVTIASAEATDPLYFERDYFWDVEDEAE